MKLRLATYNIHKSFSPFHRRRMVHELRQQLRSLDVDIVFLQEMQAVHEHHAQRFRDWPTEPQYEFLADQVWPDYAYGRNAAYDHGHHGNAILSRYPMVSAENQDVSDHSYERRGLLHCEVAVPGLHLHCLCVHLALHERGRPARTYPGALPLKRLDQIYARGLSVVRAEVHHGLPWSRISDHAALSAELESS